MRIKLLTTISGIEFKQCFEKKVVDAIDGIKVNIIGTDELKINKKASGRNKDLDDLEHLT